MSIMCITALVVLNLLGVGYSFWNGGLGITTSIRSGNMDVYFCRNKCEYELEVKKRKGDLNIYFEDFNGKGYRKLIIDGTVYLDEKSSDYKSVLHYCIKNGGSIPVKFDAKNGTIFVPSEENEENTLKITLNQPNGVLKPGESLSNANGNPKIQIDAEDVGEYNFEIVIPYKQWK